MSRRTSEHFGAGPPRHERARLFAFSLYDFADSGFATTILAVLYNQYYAGTVAGGQEGVSILGAQVPGATLYSWTVSLSMSVVALAGPFLGVLADRHQSRLRHLAAFWLPGVLLTLLLSSVGPGQWVRGAVLFGLAYIAFSAASIFYNALLPEVAPRERLGRASGIAWGIGYLGGALLLVLNLIMLKKPTLLGFPEGALTIRDCFASVALWWFVFALPIFFVFRGVGRSGRESRASVADAAKLPVRREARAVLVQVHVSFRELMRQPELRKFFLAYLLYNDGIQTVVAMASIYGAQELGMQPTSLILFFLLIQGTAFVGSIALGWLADRFGHKPTLLFGVAAWSVLTLWASAVGWLGSALREYWVIGGLAGIFLGGVQAGSRSMIAHWIPGGREAELFGFFSIMTRVAAIFGPLVYGTLVLVTGSLRWAILSVTLFFVAGGILLLKLRPERIEAERVQLQR